MMSRTNIRASLLRSCAPLALAAAVATLPQAAKAEAFNAAPTVVQGTVAIDRTIPNVDRITVSSNNAVIDWTPEIISGGGMATFLPEGTTAQFRGGPNEINFAVLNRVLTGSATDPVVFDGIVNAFLTNANGGPTTQGGLVAFYSPTGIMVGPTGRFDVAKLVLSSLAIDPAGLLLFSTGAGTLNFEGSGGTRIEIADGAAITASPEDSFVIFASPQIETAGDIFVNGSTAFLAGTAMSVTRVADASGLFDIVITGRAQEGQAIVHTGNTGGPTSSGSGDEHVIYAVANSGPGTAGTSMLFSGNLGFEPAGAAGVVNGDIILSANYNVNGLRVDGGLNRQGADSFFGGRDPVVFAPLTISLDGLSATSNVLAIGTHQTSVTGTSSYASDLVIVGREMANVSTAATELISVGGDLFVSASNLRNRNANGNPINPRGGFASVFAAASSRITVAGATQVSADAFAWSTAGPPPTVGSATGGQAQILAEGGAIELTGATLVSADARTELQGAFTRSGGMSAGRAEVLVTSGGTLTQTGGLTVTADAASPALFVSGAQPGGDAIGGNVLIGVGTGGGSLTVRGATAASASGFAGSSTALTGTGGTGESGSIVLSAIDGGSLDFGGTATPGGAVKINLSAQGGSMAGGTGGIGRAGQIAVSVIGSNARFSGDLSLGSGARGGDGTDGGDADGEQGSVQVLADRGRIDIAGALAADLFLTGGEAVSAGTGTGGDASGGNVSLRLQGETTATALGATNLAIAAIGGDSDQGLAGRGSGGNVNIDVSGEAALNLANALLKVQGSGGNTISGTGGQGSAANSQLLVRQGAAALIAGTFDVTASGQGGAGSGSGRGGTGSGGLAIVEVQDPISKLTVNSFVTVGADGTGGFRGGRNWRNRASQRPAPAAPSISRHPPSSPHRALAAKWLTGRR